MTFLEEKMKETRFFRNLTVVSHTKNDGKNELKSEVNDLSQKWAEFLKKAEALQGSTSAHKKELEDLVDGI